MTRAIREARIGLRHKHGGPFGACVVRNGRVVAVAHNTVMRDSDPTAHAEINAIREACQRLHTHSLGDCELYATAEPCPMCLGAILWARIGKLHFGVSRSVAARHGFDDAAFHREFRCSPSKRKLPTQGNVLARECETLFDEWQHSAGVLY